MVTYEYVKGKIKVLMPDGKPIDARNTYNVAMNSYLAVVCPYLKDRQSTTTGVNATDALIDYLKKQQKVDYQGVQRSKVTK